MFETNPAVKKTFEKFRQLGTPSELWQSSVLETHGMVVMHAIDEIISSFEDEEEVADLILEQGRSHARFGDDLNEEIFWVTIVRSNFLFMIVNWHSALTIKITLTLCRQASKRRRISIDIQITFPADNDCGFYHNGANFTLLFV